MTTTHRAERDCCNGHANGGLCARNVGAGRGLRWREAGATFEQVKAFVTSDAPPDGPPPVDFSRALVTAVLEGGESQITELNLTSGTYAFVCFISDRAGGPPHVAKGMINEVVVE